MRSRSGRRNAGKGLLFGLIGGAAGTIAMELYWRALGGAVGRDLRQSRAKSHRPGALDDMAIAGNQQKRGEPSTESVARIAYEAASGGDEPEPPLRKGLSQVVHWSYGCGQGALYGAIRGGTKPPDLAGGLVLGTALWGFSEVGLPALGLGKGPTAYAAEEHVATWGAHLVYGFVVSTVTQVLTERL